MVLELLELLVRGHVWVLVVEARDEADAHQVLAEVVLETTTIQVCRQWVPHGVGDHSLLKVLGLHFPDLLDTEAIGLVALPLAKVELLEDLLRDRSVTALSEDYLL